MKSEKIVLECPICRETPVYCKSTKSLNCLDYNNTTKKSINIHLIKIGGTEKEARRIWQKTFGARMIK